MAGASVTSKLTPVIKASPVTLMAGSPTDLMTGGDADESVEVITSVCVCGTSIGVEMTISASGSNATGTIGLAWAINVMSSVLAVAVLITTGGMVYETDTALPGNTAPLLSTGAT